LEAGVAKRGPANARYLRQQTKVSVKPFLAVIFWGALAIVMFGGPIALVWSVIDPSTLPSDTTLGKIGDWFGLATAWLAAWVIALGVLFFKARSGASGPTTKSNRKTRPKRERIPNEVQMFVWQRDGGRCVECGSNEFLEYDHIVPLSRGGSNTARNLQLLCQRCNRSKGARIGGRA